ncbi:hypothetical protein GCM10011344_00330 [Dokdonia pacifica]|nr:hypothetical protein GCM10011344_00330 [Dokdonia pacifica]
MTALSNAGIDLNCGIHQDNTGMTLELTPYEQELVQSLGINTQVLIADLSTFYADRAVAGIANAKTTLAAMKARIPEQAAQRSSIVSESITNVGQYIGEDEIDWAIPQNFNLGTYAGSLTLDEALAELDAMRALYPHLITAKAAAATETTIEGRTVYYVKISDNPDIDEDEPETLYNSLLHAREIATLMNQLYYMWYLLENYDTDPGIKNLLDNHELYFIPIVNPDGYQFNIDNNPNGGGLQRKNLRITSNCGGDNDGVDLNRNSGYFWNNGGASSNPCVQDYRGTDAFSEPESRILRDFVLDRDFKVALDHHGYSNILYHSYSSLDAPTGREDEFAQYSHDMSYYNRYGYGAVTETGPPVASGSHIDWLLGGTIADATGSTGSGKNILGFSPENGSLNEGGFYPDPSNILPISQRAMRINLLAAYYSGKYAKYKDLTPSNLSNTTGQLHIGIEYLGQTLSPITVTVTPISENLISIGNAQTVNLNTLEQTTLNFPYTLDPTIAATDLIEYEVTVANDDYTLYKAVVQKSYNSVVFFTDNPDIDGLNNWISNGWVTTADAFSGTTALTNASNSYGNNAFETLTLATPIDISTAEQAVIQYYAKWDIERDFDFTQIEGSIDGGATWIPLTGRYTKPGSTLDTNPYSQKSTSNEVHQPDEEPLYDGDMQDKWSLEEIVIDASSNSTLQGASSLLIRFVFDSDSSNLDSGYTTTFDGFTFDDFSVTSTILVPPASQTITFPAIADQLTTAAPVTLLATSSSGLTISYEVISGPATVSGSLLTLDGTSGTVIVEATQEGNLYFEPATSVSINFMVNEPACALETPQNLTVSAITDEGATIQWDATNGDGYEVRFRESIYSDFSPPFNVTNTQITFINQDPETSFDVKVNSVCNDGSISPDSAIISFTTLPLPITYCHVTISDDSDDFISRFELNTINNNSGGQTYSNFTAISTDIDTYRTYPFTIEPTWTGFPLPQGYAIWIDYNQDGVFDDATEQVFTQSPTNATSITGSFAVPHDALFGPTRLRVAMRFNDIPVSCGSYDYGEIEDYTVVISEGFPDTEAPTTPTNLTASNITETTAILSWNVATDAIGVTEYTVYQDDVSIATAIDTTYTVVGLAPETIYDFSVTASDLEGNESNQSTIIQVETQVQAGACVNGIESFPYTLGFENGIDTWTQNTDDDIDWTIRASSTPSGGTGPHTAIEGSYFIYTEASGNGIGYPNKQAILTSPCIDLTGNPEAYISFQYHMYGTSNNLGSLDLEVSIDDGITWTSIWGETKNLGGQWNAKIISLDAYAGLPISLRFNRITGSDFRGDVALDDIAIHQGAIPTAPPCDTTEDDFPYRVSFEIDFNDWTQSDADDIDWRRYSGNTPTGNTGPSSASNGIDYLYVEASGASHKQAILNSPCFDLTNLSTPTFSFDYHMYGNSNFGSIALEISADDSDTWVELWSLTGNQGNQWITQTIDLTAYAGRIVKLRFNRILGGHRRADLALDIFELNEAPLYTNTSVTPSRSQFTTIETPINISLYPNPVNNGIPIQIQSPVAVSFDVYTVEGKRVYTGSNTERFIPTQQLKAGVYFVQFKDEENIVTTKRFIVK